MSRFREFLYIDSPAIERLLAEVDESGTPSTAGGEQPEDASNAKRFRQLWREITNDEYETVAAAAADLTSTWNTATDNSFCEFSGQLTVPPLIAMVSAADQLQNLLQLGQRLGFLPISGNEDETLKQLSELQELIRETFPVLFKIDHIDGVELPALLYLDRSYTKVNVDRFAGRATVYGRVVERVSKTDRKEIIQIPGMASFSQLNREQRRASGRKGQKRSSEPQDLVIAGPALVIRPYAIQQ
ncbi:DUF6414 family protein [Cryptosporangium minutisporangium]|uniref:Uncharacterized protein n=1 Tax=Cryptosporangium minutisporangium TaxID=113569 RepID=A0ABP6SYM5_9ACTN